MGKIEKDLWTYLQRGFWFDVYNFIVLLLAAAIGLAGGAAILFGGNLTALAGAGLLLLAIPVYIILSGFVMTWIVEKKIAFKMKNWLTYIERGFIFLVASIVVGIVRMGAIPSSGSDLVLVLNIIMYPVMWILNGFIITYIVTKLIKK